MKYDCDFLYFKNGKPKQKYMYCLNKGKREMKRLYGQEIIQCGGGNCPFYRVGCGRSKLDKFIK
jgi:hypothetical protein